jgi:hypothetical protein
MFMVWDILLSCLSIDAETTCRRAEISIRVEGQCWDRLMVKAERFPEAAVGDEEAATGARMENVRRIHGHRENGGAEGGS